SPGSISVSVDLLFTCCILVALLLANDGRWKLAIHRLSSIVYSPYQNTPVSYEAIGPISPKIGGSRGENRLVLSDDAVLRNAYNNSPLPTRHSPLLPGYLYSGGMPECTLL